MKTCKTCNGIGTASKHCDCIEPCPDCVYGVTGFVMAGTPYDGGDCVTLVEDQSGPIVWDDINEAVYFSEEVAEEAGFLDYIIISTKEWQSSQAAARAAIRYALGFKE